jgi:hypothetical protein
MAWIGYFEMTHVGSIPGVRPDRYGELSKGGNGCDCRGSEEMLHRAL